MDQSEIKRRTPVWCALSNLFLDTELQTCDHRHIASVITEAGYTPDEAETILRTEVAPVFHMNLRAVAGDWASWDEEDVAGMVIQRLDTPVWWQKIGWLRNIILNRHMALVAGDWREIRKIL